MADDKPMHDKIRHQVLNAKKKSVPGGNVLIQAT
jgi:hypothetical protein